MICIRKKRLILVFVILCSWPRSLSLLAQLSTNDHLADPGFWPTKGDAPSGQYVGSSVCASCHGNIAETQRSTAMSRTAARAFDADILHSYPTMKFAVGRYNYQIKTIGKQPPLYTVTHPDQTLTASLLWAFGTGKVGQSYLFKRDDGKFYEARVTYFSTLHDLGFTPDRALPSPQSVQQAMSRPVEPAEVERCLACHSTRWESGGRIEEKNPVLGIQCEACHGPGAPHVSDMAAAQTSGVYRQQRIFNPGTLSPSDSVDFCGSCHTTWWDVKLSAVKGVSNVKSQPYRLESSKCWGKGDERLTCIACHDPHQQMQTDPTAYDGACLSCHASAASGEDPKHAALPCTVATKNCSSCHMPKVYVPEMHYNFTDHRIRIVRKGEAYPE